MQYRNYFKWETYGSGDLHALLETHVSDVTLVTEREQVVR
jgi:hypothetical protein